LNDTFQFGAAGGTVVEVNNVFAASGAVVDGFATLGIAVAAVGAVRGPGADRLAFAAVVLADVGWGVLSGSKQYGFTPLIWAFGAWYGLGGLRYPLRKWAYLGLALAAML